MTKFSSFFVLIDQFLTDRNWWQFHTPENDAMDILVEIGELAEHFLVPDENLEKVKISEEIADILSATISFSMVTKIDAVHSIGILTGDSRFNDSNCLYEQLQELVSQNLEKFDLDNLTRSSDVVLSLVSQASKLADMFVWSTPEQSVTRVQEKHSFVSVHVAHIVAHLVYLSTLVAINLPEQYARKMERNAIKYPAHTSSGEGYLKIKDHSRGRNT